MGLTVQCASTPAYVTATAEGEIDAGTARKFTDRVVTAWARESPIDLVLDLRRVSFLDSAGLAALVEIASKCHNAGQKLQLVCTTRAVLKPLQLTALDQVLNIVDDLP